MAKGAGLFLRLFLGFHAGWVNSLFSLRGVATVITRKKGDSAIMKSVTVKIAATIAAIAACSTGAAFAQGVTSLPNVNPDIWSVVPNANGAALVHKKSGAVCDQSFRDLTLTRVIDYAADGTDSSCEYTKTGPEGRSVLTQYFYQRTGRTGAQEFVGGKQAILSFRNSSAMTVTETAEEGKKCFNAVAQKLGPALLAKARQTDPDAKMESMAMGIAMFNFAIPAVQQKPASDLRSLLTVYQIGDWFMKTRVSVPAGKSGGINACRYGGLSSIAQVDNLKIAEGDTKAE